MRIETQSQHAVGAEQEQSSTLDREGSAKEVAVQLQHTIRERRRQPAQLAKNSWLRRTPAASTWPWRQLEAARKIVGCWTAKRLARYRASKQDSVSMASNKSGERVSA